jgi:O-antigen/teichoic acid export membrane protein
MFSLKSIFLKCKFDLSASFFTYLFGSVLNLLASYSLLIFLLNSLPKTEYGQYGLYISLLSILLIFFNFGHKEAIFKLTSKSSENHISAPLKDVLTTYCQWNLCILIVIQLLLLIDFTYYFAAMATLMNGWLIALTAYYRGRSIYKVDALTLPIQRAIWLVSALVLYYTFEVMSLSFVFAASMVATVICLLFIFSPFVTAPAILSTTNQKSAKQTKLLFNFFIIELASVFYLKADVLLLRLFSVDLVAIADYFFAIQLFEIVALVIMPIGYFYFNSLSKNYLDVTIQTIKNYLFVMLIIVFSIHVGIYFLAPIIFPMIIPEYTSSISSVLLIMFSLYPVCFNILLSSRLIFDNKEVVFAKICFAALIFNFAVNIVFIPYFDIYAVLIIKFMTEILISLLLIKTIFFPTTTSMRNT